MADGLVNEATDNNELNMADGLANEATEVYTPNLIIGFRNGLTMHFKQTLFIDPDISCPAQFISISDLSMLLNGRLGIQTFLTDNGKLLIQSPSNLEIAGLNGDYSQYVEYENSSFEYDRLGEDLTNIGFYN
jgi:hypothetical protein